jgi:hypothetical protein
MWYTAPTQLLKAESNSKENRIDILIRASDESLDDENDNVYSSAFTEEVRKEFLDIGIIDYDHETIRGSTSLEKSNALIGTPTKFYQDTEEGVPVQYIEGYLHYGNPHVDNSIGPAFKAGSDRYGSSIGGRVLGYEPNSNGGKSVHKITMNHIAICPKYKAVNKKTWAKAMVKSGDLIEFNSVFSLCKSLEAGSITDMANISGGQAIQPQSLEHKKVRLHHINNEYPKSKAVGKQVIMDVLNDEIEESYNSIVKRAMAYGLNMDQAGVIAKMILVNLSDKIGKMKLMLDRKQNMRSMLKVI